MPFWRRWGREVHDRARAGAVRGVGARRSRGVGGAARAGLRRMAGRPRRRSRSEARGRGLGRALERSRAPRPGCRRRDRARPRVAPLSLVDEATLGVPLALGGRVRHGAGRVDGGEREPTLDGTGTLRGVDAAVSRPIRARLRAWGAVTLAYLAGLADGALEKAVEHARSREQFGAPLAALPAVQARLADAALARDGLLLSAWSAADAGGRLPSGVARLGRERVSRSDAARAAGARRHRLRTRGGHPPVLPPCEDGAGVDGCAAARGGRLSE